jgi:hypothetical protein
MILILISAVWLTVALFIVLLCRAAADADSVLLASTERVGSLRGAAVNVGVRVHLRGQRTWRRAPARTPRLPRDTRVSR